MDDADESLFKLLNILQVFLNIHPENRTPTEKQIIETIEQAILTGLGEPAEQEKDTE